MRGIETEIYCRDFLLFFPRGNYKNSYSSPVLADVNNDNIREIIFGSQSQSGPGCVHIIKNDGTVYPNSQDNETGYIHLLLLDL